MSSSPQLGRHSAPGALPLTYNSATPMEQAAKAAGMTCIAVPDHGVAQLDLSQADRIMTSLNDVRDFLPQLIAAE